jgi:hypothetical protein
MINFSKYKKFNTMNSNILNTVLCIFFFIIIGITTGCSQDEPPVKASIYEPCCGTQPTIFKRGLHVIYSSNVFTPNKDGKNDVFYPVLNNDSIVISGFFIKTMTDTTIYFRDRLYYENIDNEAWNGTVFENVFFPELQRKEYAGQFKYMYTILYPDGSSQDVENTACVVRCGPNAAIIKTKTGCYFPNQINKNVFDSSVDANEMECFR